MSAFRKNEPSVASETIDGEVVVINLDSGTYFSLQRTAAEIWGMIENGLDEAGIVRNLDHRYGGANGEIPGAVSGFLSELRAEKLIVPAEAGHAASAAPAPHQDSASLPFEKPTLSKYSDMQDLLLLDPIHEVDEKGWPHIKPQG